MSGKISADGLDELAKDLLELGEKQFPKKTKNFMQRAGNKLRTIARNEYKADLGKGKGKARYKESDGKKQRTDLIGGLSRGSAYIYNGNEHQVRVKNKAKHAHLYEHGHVTNAKKPNKEKFVRGKNTIGRAANKFAQEYPDMAEAYVDELLKEGLR